jgi:hypothetical protein
MLLVYCNLHAAQADNPAALCAAGLHEQHDELGRE